jgi:tetratricopeptide (TPR) repeat protein/V8-like Glu-specific endopeptidase
VSISQELPKNVRSEITILQSSSSAICLDLPCQEKLPMKQSAVIISILGATVALYGVLPASAQQLTSPQIAKIAKQSTVRIENADSPGSGVIISKKGGTYLVLTAAHVLKDPSAKYQVALPDGSSQALSNIKTFPSKIDLAVGEFSSTQNYSVSKLAKDSSEVSEGSTVYVSGFPVTATIDLAVFNFTEGKVTANSSKPLQDGYSLVYSNNTLPGHSGGPVWNDRGEVIAIHGKGDVDTKLSASEINPNIRFKTGFNLGITMNTFTQTAAAAGINGFAASTVVAKLTPVDDLLVSGLAKMTNRQYAESIDDFDRAILANPQRSAAYLYRGTARSLLISSKVIQSVTTRLETDDRAKQRFTPEYQLALSDFQRAYKLSPKSTWALEGAANTQNDLGNYAQAIKILDVAIATKPTDNAYGLRAVARSKTADLVGALADYTTAIKLAPHTAFYYGMRSGVYAEQKNYPAALADLNKALQIEPKNLAYYMNRAAVRSKAKQGPGAILDYNQAVKLNKNPAIQAILITARGAEYLNQDNYKAAIVDFSSVLQANSRDSTALYFRATAYNFLQQYPQALADLAGVVQIEPNFADAHFLRGVIYLDIKQPQLSLSNLNKSFALVQADPSKKYLLPRLYGNRSGAYYLLRDRKKALADANKAIELDAQSGRALYYRGLIKADRGDTANALKDLEAAAALFQEFKSVDRYRQAITKIKQIRSRRR